MSIRLNNNKLKCAIIGYGYMGEIRHRVVDQLESAELTLICETDEGTITEHQNCFRGGKKQPLTKEDIDKKYKANLKFSKLSDKEQDKLTNFVHNFFEKPAFQDIDFE